MRPKQTTLSCTLLLLFATGSVEAGGPANDRITWSEFSTRVTPKHTIRLLLPDGTLVEGQPLEVNTDAMELHMTRTSNKAAHAKGNTKIPRASVSVVEVRTPRYAGKLIGTLVPIVAGAALMAAAFSSEGDDLYGYLAAGAAIAGGGAPAGFFIGRAADRRFVSYVIVPEEQLGKRSQLRTGAATVAPEGTP